MLYSSDRQRFGFQYHIKVDYELKLKNREWIFFVHRVCLLCYQCCSRHRPSTFWAAVKNITSIPARPSALSGVHRTAKVNFDGPTNDSKAGMAKREHHLASKVFLMNATGTCSLFDSIGASNEPKQPSIPQPIND